MVFMPKSLLGRSVRIFVVLLGVFHISFGGLLSNLSNL